MDTEKEKNQQTAKHPFTRKLSKHEINELDIRAYDGPIEIIRTDEEIARAVKKLRKEKLLGFDTETRPAFKKGVSYPTALLQLAAKDCVYIFQLKFINDLERLFSILSDKNITKAGVSIRDDIKDLRKLSDFEPAGFCDIGNAARNNDIPHHGLRGLTALMMGFRITKSGQKYNWSQSKLRKTAITYAATDAWVGRELYKLMKAHNCL